MSADAIATLAYGLVVDASDLDAGVASIADALGVTAHDGDEDTMTDAIREHVEAIGLRFEPVGSWEVTSWLIGLVVVEADADTAAYALTTLASVARATKRTRGSREVFAALRRAFGLGPPRVVLTVMRRGS